MTNSELFTLPHPGQLLKRSKALATLDALYCQQWDLRCFSHNSRWSENEQMASMRDGEGNDYFIRFAPFGTAVKGTYIENGTFENNEIADKARAEMPKTFESFLSEPAFSVNEASFIAWFDEKIEEWKKTVSNKGDGSDILMECIQGDGMVFKNWAYDYYEIDIKLEFIEHVFQFMPIDAQFIEQLGVYVDRNLLREDLGEIGYPYTEI